MSNTTLPAKVDLVGNPTAGTYKIALGQLYDYIQESINNLDTNKLALDGGIMSGILTLSGDPTTALHAATKQYVDDHGGLNNWRANKSYGIGDICYSANAPSYVRMECVVGGITGETEPTWPVVGQYVMDGTVKWIVDDIRDGALPGDIAPPSMIVRPGRIKTMGQLVNRADYPRVTKFATDNNLIATEAGWAAGLWGLFGAGDGSTTIRFPDLRDEHIRFLDDGRYADKTNITGNITIGSATITALASTVMLAVGMPISGSGIPAGATIASIVNSTSITISAAATATAIGVILTVSGRILGSAELDTEQGHWHDVKRNDGGNIVVYGSAGSNVSSITGAAVSGTITLQARGIIADDTNGTPRVGPETRGRNVAYYATMKY